MNVNVENVSFSVSNGPFAFHVWTFFEMVHRPRRAKAIFVRQNGHQLFYDLKRPFIARWEIKSCQKQSAYMIQMHNPCLSIRYAGLFSCGSHPRFYPIFTGHPLKSTAYFVSKSFCIRLIRLTYQIISDSF